MVPSGGGQGSPNGLGVPAYFINLCATNASSSNFCIVMEGGNVTTRITYFSGQNIFYLAFLLLFLLDF